MTDPTRPKRPPSALAPVAPPARIALLTSSTQAEKVERVMRTYFARLRPTTVKNYSESLRVFEVWCEQMGHIRRNHPQPMNAVSELLFALEPLDAHVMVQEYVQYLSAKYSPNTVQLRLAALRSLVRVGKQTGLCKWDLDVHAPAAENVRDVRGPELAQVQDFLARTQGAEAQAMLRLLFECGLRSIEVRELQVKHLGKGEVFIRGKGKTGLRPVSVSKSVERALKLWLAQRKNLGPDDYVFVGRNGRALSAPAISKRVTGWGKKVGLHVWPHALRHSAITALLDATNGDVRSVQKFSRHSKLETVMKYDDERKNVGAVMRAKLGSMVPEAFE
jgi:integrase/recombinase XerC